MGRGGRGQVGFERGKVALRSRSCGECSVALQKLPGFSCSHSNVDSKNAVACSENVVAWSENARSWSKRVAASPKRERLPRDAEEREEGRRAPTWALGKDALWTVDDGLRVLAKFYDIDRSRICILKPACAGINRWETPDR
eukprot:1174496-Rhodomonas_salina.3